MRYIQSKQRNFTPKKNLQKLHPSSPKKIRSWHNPSSGAELEKLRKKLLHKTLEIQDLNRYRVEFLANFYKGKR